MQELDHKWGFFALARQGKRLTPALLAVPLGWAFVFLFPAIVGIPLVLVFQAVFSGLASIAAISLYPALEFVVMLLVGFVPIIMLVWLWVALYERRHFWTLGFERAYALLHYLRGMLVGLGMYAATVGIPAAFGFMATEQGDPSQQGLAALGGVLFVYLGWTVQGPAEEILCRGWLLQVIGVRYRPWIGVLVSSLFFMVLHISNSNVSLIALLNLFLFGVFTALYAIWEGGLWGVCSIHAVWNWAQGNLFGIEVSGQNAAGGTLFNLQETGPDLITGGAFGSEGGLAATVVLVCGIIVLLVLLRRAVLSSEKA